MKAIVHERYGMPDVLELRDVDLPAIEDHQVLLRVHAASVNPVEWYGVTGPYFTRLFGGGLRRPKSTTVGADVAGRVEAVGKDVTEFQPGDEVFGTSGGAWAEYARRPRGSPRAEAGQRVVRGSGGRPDRGNHRPPGAARQGGRSARARRS